MAVHPLHSMSWGLGARSQNVEHGGVDQAEEGLVGVEEGECLVQSCCVAACGSHLVQPRAMLAAG